ncbi:sulfotransferase [Aliikangiella sp. G2MR2-5]|uniref:tetratricopeptide repeat-containing sulfotransferase family protein n=1 Tax=Aliikangiella sp. G2MR2-5 TaxID=2788943 RepID=UPI001AEDFAAF|nr:sulfotransferase [Aliikangiella sp. G2MR2-5]
MSQIDLSTQLEQAKLLLQRGKIIDAIEFCRNCLALKSEFLPMSLLLNQAYQLNSQFDLMLSHAKELAESYSDNPVIQIRLVECLIYSGEIAEAIKNIDRLFQRAGSNSSFLSKLGELYLHCCQHQKVFECHQKAYKINPDDCTNIYNLAAAQINLGQFDSARKLLDKVIEKNKSDFDPFYNRSAILKADKENNNIEQLLSQLKWNRNNPLATCPIAYALGKEYEDIGEFEKAFYYLDIAAKSRRRRMQYQVDTDVEVMNQIRKTYSKEKLSRVSVSNSNDSPIFIFGLPRSGTTLVERILSSHSSVESLGEINSLAFSIMHSVGPNLGKIDLVRKSININFDWLASRYKSATAGYGFNARYLIDKTPLNFLYLGIIKLAFPKAKVIHISRDPMDSCYAMYKTLFRMGYPFSYELSDLGHYYIAYSELMKHWDDLFGKQIFHIQYERLVENPAAEIEALLEYCQLSWEDSVLSFYNKKSPVATASAIQVRQPIYRSSVGRWKKYEEQLKSLKCQLENSGICCD